MLDALRNALRIEDLRRKILYTAALLIVFRIGSFVPVPGVDAVALSESLGIGTGNIFGFLNMFTGGALGRFTIFAMGVNPYITASIILQLLTIVIPRLEEMAKEGVEGRKKIQQYTRYGTVVLGLFQGWAITALARNTGVLTDTGPFSILLILVTLTAGTSFLMWLGEKITEHGIGNGISLIIFAGIIAELPVGVVGAIQSVGQGGVSVFALIVLAVLAVVIIAAVILVQEGQRRIPVQYAKRVVGRRMYGGQATHIPLRVNNAGVIPVIFASSILTFPLTVAQFIPSISPWVDRWFGIGTTAYLIAYALLVIFFTYFYTAVTFNPVEVANNMRKNGGFIPGLRPGKPTSEYLDRILTRITLAGAVFLAVVAILPYIVGGVVDIPLTYIFGGTSVLIVVGVALDTMKQIEAHLLMRHYEGFMK